MFKSGVLSIGCEAVNWICSVFVTRLSSLSFNIFQINTTDKRWHLNIWIFCICTKWWNDFVLSDSSTWHCPVLIFKQDPYNQFLLIVSCRLFKLLKNSFKNIWLSSSPIGRTGPKQISTVHQLGTIRLYSNQIRSSLEELSSHLQRPVNPPQSPCYNRIKTSGKKKAKTANQNANCDTTSTGPKDTGSIRRVWVHHAVC